jgi:hypothetical protein
MQIEKLNVHVLIVRGVGAWKPGKRSKMQIKVTQATAMEPVTVDHRPRVKGPGTNRALPEVIRRKIGTVYDV